MNISINIFLVSMMSIFTVLQCKLSMETKQVWIVDYSMSLSVFTLELKKNKHEYNVLPLCVLSYLHFLTFILHCS